MQNLRSFYSLILSQRQVGDAARTLVWSLRDVPFSCSPMAAQRSALATKRPPPARPARAMPPLAFAAAPRCGPPPTTPSSAPAVCRRQLLVAAALLATRRVLSPAAAGADADEGYVRAASGLEVRDYRVGSGRAAAVGDVVVVKWTGRLADRFGWSFQREDAGEVAVLVGDGDEVIRGFREGVVGDGDVVAAMREGGKRRIVIPRELGYTREGQAPVPADFGDRRRLYSTVLNKRRPVSAGALVVDVELRKLRRR
jgi:FKBP-type peptidyl-prolyl cis-trans isomerase